jgi:hypothetical protein
MLIAEPEQQIRNTITEVGIAILRLLLADGVDLCQVDSDNKSFFSISDVLRGLSIEQIQILLPYRSLNNQKSNRFFQ